MNVNSGAYDECSMNSGAIDECSNSRLHYAEHALFALVLGTAAAPNTTDHQKHTQTGHNCFMSRNLQLLERLRPWLSGRAPPQARGQPHSMTGRVGDTPWTMGAE